ncbi:MAG: ATP-binding protein [Gammaproteobacteria bacterium]|nr:ATP-binding protein [Gammaproteobacteria bacterium]MCZ6717489.1 ATP-binding protein [Gammaproteobacteria bacterium]MCZ6825894.1 ATP-binding protein [Gammaproteobacteria bacterium]
MSRRLFLSSTMLLVVFLGAAGIILDTAFREAGNQALEDLLEVQILTMLGAVVEVAGPTLVMPDDLAEARFLSPGSGLYGEIVEPGGGRVWRSPSLLGSLDFGGWLDPGESYTRRLDAPNGQQLMALSMGIEWEFDNRESRQYRLTVAQDMESHLKQVTAFRKKLLTWFSGLTVLLLIAQALVLRRGLQPLRQVENEISAIETGERSELSSDYPRELTGVTANLNALITSERGRLKRYRDTLDNLAHSLKTPLAASTSLLEEAESPDRDKLARQLARMRDIVDFQLKRASVTGVSGLGQEPIDVRSALHQLREALDKVYLHKGLEIELEITPGAKFFGSKDDLLEMMGNLMDNACKWANKKVSVRADVLSGKKRPGLELGVEDDGPGIPVDKREDVLGKGVRGDERMPGQGIGLAVVREITELYSGRLTVTESGLGGARISLRFGDFS